MDDGDLRVVITRLARPHSSGGSVIERATILAEGPRSTEILAWIADHDGKPEMAAPAIESGGLHSSRLADGRATAPSGPRRYVLPPGALS
jgi:hypothetical protein